MGDKLRIAHAGDIHVRLFKRHKEYRAVFDRFYESIKNNNIDHIVLAGDLVHNKTNLSPEAINLLSDFLYTCNELCPTHVIVGNHDCIVNQPGRLDAISPVIRDFNNVKLYKNSGIYEFAPGFHFGVFAINDDKNFPVKILDKKEENVYIALYHGAVNGATTDVEYKLKTDHNSKMFIDYDFAMLADIHKCQTLRYNKNDIADIKYSGSLIQQNFGETVDKGYLIWDIDKKNKYNHSVKRELIENEYGFYTIGITEDNIENFDSIKCPNISKKPYIRLIVNTSDYNHITLKELANYVKEKFNPVSLAIETDIDTLEKDIEIKDLEIENVYQLPIQQKLINSFLKNYKLTEDENNKILSIHSELFNTSIVGDKNVYKGSNWHIHNIKYNNTFAYGEDNYVDFNHIRGLVGIFSPNASGKSALLDSLLMGFFNSCSRASRKNIVDVINKNENNASIEIIFDVDDKRYKIIRTIDRNVKDHKRANNIVYLYEYIDGEYVNLLGEKNVRGTEIAIRDLLGNFEEHSMATFGLQNDLTAFIEVNQSHRKELLAKFMGLNVIEHLCSATKDEANSLKTLIKQYQKHDYRSIRSKLINQSNTFKDELQELKKTKKYISKDLELKKNSISELKLLLKEIDGEDLDENKVKRTLEATDNRITSRLKEINNIEQNIKNKEIILKRKRSLLSESCDEREKYLHEEVYRLKDAKDKLPSILSSLDIARNRRTDLNRQLSILQKHEWFETNDLCKKCTFLKDAFIAKDDIQEIDTEIVSLKEEFEKLEELIEKNIFLEEELDNILKNRRETESFEFEITKYKLDLSHEKDSLRTDESLVKELKNSLDEFEKNKDIIVNNDKIHREISILSDSLNIRELEYRSIEENIANSNIKLGQIVQKISDLEESISTLSEVEESFRLHSILQETLSKNGIQLSIIKKIIPRINIEISKILSSIQEFDILLEEEDDDIFIYIEDTSSRRRIELGSGMEKTIAAIAIRAALSNISLLPKCNLFIIDEGFGTLDNENLNNMNMLLGYLKSIFTSVVIISHITEMQDITDHIISVEKDEKGYSKLKIGE